MGCQADAPAVDPGVSDRSAGVDLIEGEALADQVDAKVDAEVLGVISTVRLANRAKTMAKNTTMLPSSVIVAISTTHADAGKTVSDMATEAMTAAMTVPMATTMTVPNWVWR